MGVEDSAGGIIEEGQQDCSASYAFLIGDVNRVHEIGLDTLKGREELELQVLLVRSRALSLSAVQAK